MALNGSNSQKPEGSGDASSAATSLKTIWEAVLTIRGRKTSGEPEASLSFAQVFPLEVQHINDSRVGREVPSARDGRSADRDLIGLAFSGGGIRSATFNLGVIEALAGARLLRWMDYLSTVSGGGYIGSWLSSWTYHVKKIEPTATNHIGHVESALSGRASGIGDCPEPPQIRFLRQYSNYLTPRLGVLSGDTLAFVGTYLRNLLLNQSILISLMLAILVFPRVLGLLLSYPELEGYIGYTAGGLALALLIWILVKVTRNIVPQTSDNARAVVKWIAVPQYVFCFLITIAVWQLAKPGRLLNDAFQGWRNGVISCLASAAVYTTFWAVGTLLSTERRHMLRWIPVFWAPVAGLAAGGFAAWGVGILGHWDVWYAMTFGVPVTMAMMLVTGSLHLGLIGRSFGDAIREWWARLGGINLAITLYGFLLCFAAAFVPLLVQLCWHLASGHAADWTDRALRLLSSVGLTGGVVGWILATLRGLFFAKGAETGSPPGEALPTDSEKAEKKGWKPTKDQWARWAPAIFVVGLLAFLSDLTYLLAPVLTSNARPSTAEIATDHSRYWAALSNPPDLVPLGILCISLFLLSLLLGWRVDVNEFSLHNAYRNRLVRCYLGATNPARYAQPFTGFDENDNIQLDCLNEVAAPFHILNATLNAVKANDLALQARKGRSFAFTPLYSGFGNGVPNDPAYRLTRNLSWHSWQYHGARLGTAMAISGAAASPNMGFYTKSAVAFLLTVFSVRLGWWLGNPKKQKWWEAGRPRSSWRALMNELTGATTDTAAEVYLSDGGHFDNLGVYELVRRRCRVIVACDAGADPIYSCTDLIRLVEKCRVDFNTHIKIELDEVRPALPLTPGDVRLRVSKSPYSCGTITYPDGSLGTLIYIKPCLNTDLDPDVLAYARQARDFPHQTTVDQFFDENQFESYRAVGFACGEAATDVIGKAVRAQAETPAG